VETPLRREFSTCGVGGLQANSRGAEGPGRRRRPHRIVLHRAGVRRRYLVANGAQVPSRCSPRDPVPFKRCSAKRPAKAARRLHESKGVKFVIGELQSFASDAQGGLSGLKLKSGDPACSALRVGIGYQRPTPPSCRPSSSPVASRAARWWSARTFARRRTRTSLAAGERPWLRALADGADAGPRLPPGRCSQAGAAAARHLLLDA
uniref:Uncharacterized protein n=1 Tax=Macrostomum lignano TaxID=282301 RepID=A0A1I8FPG8_9PLAT